VVPGARAREVVGFMLEPADSAYRSWWPGVHDRFARLGVLLSGERSR